MDYKDKSAEALRSFSLLRRLKTHLQSTMSEEHLSDLFIIAMHYSERVPIDEVWHLLRNSYPSRLFDFSLLILRLIIKHQVLFFLQHFKRCTLSSGCFLAVKKYNNIDKHKENDCFFNNPHFWKFLDLPLLMSGVLWKQTPSKFIFIVTSIVFCELSFYD